MYPQAHAAQCAEQQPATPLHLVLTSVPLFTQRVHQLQDNAMQGGRQRRAQHYQTTRRNISFACGTQDGVGGITLQRAAHTPAHTVRAATSLRNKQDKQASNHNTNRASKPCAFVKGAKTQKRRPAIAPISTRARAERCCTPLIHSDHRKAVANSALTAPTSLATRSYGRHHREAVL